MAGFSGTVQLEGTADLISRLQADHLLAKPVRRLLSRVGILGKRQGKSMAPRQSGRLAASVTSHLSSRTIPSFVAIRVTARGTGNFPYPRLLEYSPKHGHKNWLTNALSSAAGEFSSFVRDAANDIEQQFRGRHV